MPRKVVKVWDYPEELLAYEEQPHTIRRWTEEEAHALMCKELRQQHDLLMQLVDLFAESDVPVPLGAKLAPQGIYTRGVEVAESEG